MSGKYALVIGNTEYTDPRLAQLTAPGKDTEDFARILRDPELAAFDDVKVLLNEPSYTIIEAIDEFFAQRKRDDLLVVYFSGHGVRDELGSLYLAVKNTARTKLRSTAIRSDYISESMEQSWSKRQVLILDCCNSGAFPQGTKAEVGGTMGMVAALQGYGRFILTASDATQFAWEGDKVIGTTQNSLFTHFLVKGLQGEADLDGDGRITVDELYDYAYEEVCKLTPKQTPTKSASKQEGEIVLRLITRISDIKPIPLPGPLLDSIENPFVDIRFGAVQQLINLLNGKNLGLARSAREALEKISVSDDSYRIRQAATEAVEPLRKMEQLAAKAEEENKAREAAAQMTAEPVDVNTQVDIVYPVEEQRQATEVQEIEQTFTTSSTEQAAKQEDIAPSAIEVAPEPANTSSAAVENISAEVAEPVLSEEVTKEQAVEVEKRGETAEDVGTAPVDAKSGFSVEVESPPGTSFTDAVEIQKEKEERQGQPEKKSKRSGTRKPASQSRKPAEKATVVDSEVKAETDIASVGAQPEESVWKFGKQQVLLGLLGGVLYAAVDLISANALGFSLELKSAILIFFGVAFGPWVGLITGILGVLIFLLLG